MIRIRRPRLSWTGGPVLYALGLLLVLPVLMVAGLPGLVAVTATCLHFIRFCFATIAGADGALHVAMLALIFISCLHAVRVTVRAWRRGSGHVRRLATRTPRPRDAIYPLAERYGLLRHLRIIEGPALNPAFTAGLWRPRIFVAAWLQHELAPSELEAVLLHEQHHLRRRDPLRSLVLWAVGDFFFWIPLVRYEMSEAIARLEFAADDFARRSGDLPLASAIVKVADQARPVALASLFATPSLVQRRVHRLLGDDTEKLRPDRRTLAWSAAGIAALWLVGLLSSGTHVSHTRGLDQLCPHQHELHLLHSAH